MQSGAQASPFIRRLGLFSVKNWGGGEMEWESVIPLDVFVLEKKKKKNPIPSTDGIEIPNEGNAISLLYQGNQITTYFLLLNYLSYSTFFIITKKNY